MKSAKIYMYDRYAGRLTEDENGFQFVYDSEYLAAEGAEPISLTMPLRKEPYEDKVLFPFFDGLVPAAARLLQRLHRSGERGAGRGSRRHGAQPELRYC